MEKLSGKHFPAAVLKEVNDNMAMEELQQVQELEKELAAQYAAAQADAKRRIAVEQRVVFIGIVAHGVGGGGARLLGRAARR